MPMSLACIVIKPKTAGVKSTAAGGYSAEDPVLCWSAAELFKGRGSSPGTPALTELSPK